MSSRHANAGMLIYGPVSYRISVPLPAHSAAPTGIYSRLYPARKWHRGLVSKAPPLIQSGGPSQPDYPLHGCIINCLKPSSFSYSIQHNPTRICANNQNLRLSRRASVRSGLLPTFRRSTFPRTTYPAIRRNTERRDAHPSIPRGSRFRRA